MSIEDRVRIATEATAATVCEIRPLTLPEDTEWARPHRFRPQRARRAWGGWLIPLAAAVAVVVVAAVLVAVRDLPGLGHASGVTPAGHGSPAPGLPRYGVVLTQAFSRIPPKYGSADVETDNLNVFDTRTGKLVLQVKHPKDIGFSAVTGAADDRTFLVEAFNDHPVPLPGTPIQEDTRIYYLLRIAPGTSRPYTLTRLSIPAQSGEAVIDGLALSPDGRTLALMEWCTVRGACYSGAPGALRLYSVATGKVLRTWGWGTLPSSPVPRYGDMSENSAGLTWLPDRRTLAFTYYAKGQAPVVRTLDTSRPGDDLVAGSRRVFTLPTSGPDACAEAQLTADGRTVICGTVPNINQGCKPGQTETLEIDAYSAATGKRTGVLYRYTGQCTKDGVGALGWVGPGNTVVVMVNTGTFAAQGKPFTVKTVIGVLTQGNLVPLVPATVPFAQGPGAIAF
ncbi:MAG TPA: hypothetical protein VN714_19450 [Trebonia sp.]|jgi:hypothetical protein|nr:hypothetical protein [Trebonia sp.]